MTGTGRPFHAAALLLTIAAIAVGIATRPLLPVDETRYLTVAWEMWRDGGLLVPHLNGAPYHHKPPLLFWSVSLAWSLFGVGETVARLVPPLFTLGAVALVPIAARLLWPGRAAVGGLAALVLASTGLVATMGTLVMFDAALTFFTLVGIIAMLLVWRRGDGRWWLLFGVALGLGVLTKGPVALLHLLPAGLLGPLWQRRDRTAPPGRWCGGLAGGVAVGTAIGLAWALPAAAAGGPAFGSMLLWGQTAGRVVQAFDHARPWWFYLALMPAALWPWLWWPPVWRGVRSLVPADDGVRFCAVWAIGGIGVLSVISGKQAHYLLPIVPAVSLLTARALDEVADAERRRALVPLLPLFAGGLGLAGAIMAAGTGPAARLPRLLVEIQWGLPAGFALACLALGLRRGVAAVAAAALLLFGAVHLAGAEGAFAPYRLAPLAERLAADGRQGLAFVGGYHGEFGFLARLDRPVAELTPETLPAWLAAHPQGMVVARLREGRGPEALDWPPAFKTPYRGVMLGLWRGADRPPAVTERTSDAAADRRG